MRNAEMLLDDESKEDMRAPMCCCPSMREVGEAFAACTTAAVEEEMCSRRPLRLVRPMLLCLLLVLVLQTNKAFCLCATTTLHVRSEHGRDHLPLL